MKNLFCGIDVSKDFLDYAFCFGTDKKIVDVSKVENTKKGILQLIKSLLSNARKDELWVCFEHTGHYGLLLAKMLEENEVTYSMVSSLDIIKSSGLTRGKSDPIDAKRIALYLATYAFKLKPTILPSSDILKVKNLLAIRSQYVKVRTQFKNALKSLRIVGKNISLTTEIKEYKKEIERYDILIKKIEAKISGIIKSNECLLKYYNKITKIPGIGLITSASLIVSTNNFSSFTNPRKFNCYCGIAPFEYSSGSSVRGRTKTSYFRNKEMKAMLFHAANTAIRCDQQIRAYYKRKLSEGKHKMNIINAVACKIVYRIFAVIKREEPYVKLII